MDIRNMTALEIGEQIRQGHITSIEVIKEYLEAIKKEDSKINAYITVAEEEVLKQAEIIQDRIDKGEKISPLAGVPVAVEDSICTKGIKTTAASKMLHNFIPTYNATVIEKLQNAGAVIIGKTNQDEFGMGNSTESSYFAATKNPWNLGYPSGGSAAAVAAKLASYALASDTDGAIRQSCSFCNATGIKPTYGSVSRYGLIAYASSLEQIGTIGRDIQDCAAVLSIISGLDSKDISSSLEQPFDFKDSFNRNDTKLKGLRIGIPINYFEKGLSTDIKKAILEAAEEFKRLGATVEEIEIPTIDYAVSAYYIIACAEASSNLSRYDGIKYGYRSEKAENLLEVYYKSRSEGFGEEVKRRILLGSLVLSSGYYDSYYRKALKVRSLIKKEFDKVFSNYHVILSPVSPTTVHKIGEQVSDPLTRYLADIYTVSVNLSGLPAVSLPCGIDSKGMPIGMQLIGQAFSEKLLIKAAYAYQMNTDHHKLYALYLL